MDETLNRKDKTQFKIELILALVITGLACAAGMSNLLFASNDLYPAATDAMGHIAKVQYITQCLQKGIVPSWYPYWYCGSAVNQYYPLLSYYLMVPIYAFTGNVMLTFKINCFLMMFAGGMGIWYFCRTIIGKWCGLIAIVLYCLQPFLLGSLYMAGVLAQGPVYAMTPWFLLSILNCAKKPTRLRVLACTALSTALILSHAMHAFIIVLCIMLLLLVFVIIRKVDIVNYVITACSIIFSGLLTAFWSVVGVTGFENPTIPYILPEVVDNVTAKIEWFDPRNMSSFVFYFALPVLAFSVIAVLAFLLRASRKRLYNFEKLEIPFLILLTCFTLVFSFGKKIPGFTMIPMAGSIVAGRILSLTAVTGAILSAYVLYLLIGILKEKETSTTIRLLLPFLFIAAGSVSLYHLNPYQFQFGSMPYDSYGKRFETVDASGGPFGKGRYTWFTGLSSDEASVPVSYGFNIADGWNMEGSPHNRVLWNHLSCLPTGTYDYYAKNLAFWNVRYLEIIPMFEDITGPLCDTLGFKLAYGNEFYASNEPSSYFLKDYRNALILGIGAPGIAMEFPYLVYEQRNSLFDYSLNELEQYKLIYLCEPAVDTVREKEDIEKTVEKLVNSGVKVVIEPTGTKGLPIFGITTIDVMAEKEPLLRKQKACPINSGSETIRVEGNLPYFRVLFGLDDVYYKLDQNAGRLQNDIIGTKNVGDGEVIFMGMHLSQYLKAVYARNWGVPDNATGYPECSDDVKALFEDIFSTYGVNKDFWPDLFPVKAAKWNYKGVDFEYSSPTAKEMTVSVTYSPRWKATLDGKLIPVGQKENLITLALPAGDHKVKLVYGLTKYGIAGYIISLLGLLIFILFLIFYDIILYHFRQICTKTGKFLQIGSDNKQRIN